MQLVGCGGLANFDLLFPGCQAGKGEQFSLFSPCKNQELLQGLAGRALSDGSLTGKCTVADSGCRTGQLQSREQLDET